MDKAKDHCAIFGAFNTVQAARNTYFGLHAQQHRGQESCGIVTSCFDEKSRKQTMPLHKDFGLVLDVFPKPEIFETKLLGDSAIGHTRYSTSGSSTNPANIQPFLIYSPKVGNIGIAHNGNLTNTKKVRRTLFEKGAVFSTSSDTEIILHLVAHSQAETTDLKVVDAVSQVEGAFSLVLLTDESLIAVRDPSGFRPLCIGKKESTDSQGGVEYFVASESCAFDIIGAEYIRDVNPGEVLVIDREGIDNGKFKSYQLEQPFGVSQCVFEYVYFSRPDSIVFGEMTDKVRRKIGKQLAVEAPTPKDPVGKRTIVISVPDSSNTAALGYVSECLKLGHDCRYEIGLIRNHYVGRTFIAPGQDERELKVRCKFNTVAGVLKDRIVVLVDDSIVRGTTCKLLVKMIRQAGAREVHFRVASPKVISPCYYGMDFPSKEELIVNRFENDMEKIREFIGVDSLVYLSPEGLMSAVKAANPNGQGYCNACFTNQYPVPINEFVSKEEND